jgi:hypothetical protein
LTGSRKMEPPPKYSPGQTYLRTTKNLAQARSHYRVSLILPGRYNMCKDEDR